MAKDADLKDIEERLRKLEVAMAVHGLKIGAIVAAMVAFGGILWNVLVKKIGEIFS